MLPSQRMLFAPAKYWRPNHYPTPIAVSMKLIKLHQADVLSSSWVFMRRTYVVEATTYASGRSDNQRSSGLMSTSAIRRQTPCASDGSTGEACTEQRRGSQCR